MNTFDVQTFASADTQQQNDILDQLRDQGDLFPLLAELLERAVTDQPLWFLSAYSGYASLRYAESRQDWKLFRPAFRRFICDYAELPADEGRLAVAPLIEEYGLDIKPKAFDKMADAIAAETVANGGPSVWQQIMALVNLARLLPESSDGHIEAEPILGLALEHMLSSRRLLKVVHIWDEVWKRIPLVDSDLYYHDSRLRRAILDQNIDHAFRLVAATIKSGLPAEEVVGHFIKATYDIDFSESEQMLLLPAGLMAVLAQGWEPMSQEFQHAMARFIYDVMHFERSDDRDRIEYEQISLIKSREILIDFRKTFLQSIFLQAWGIAEYAFVHGFEASEVLDEVYRVVAAIGEDAVQNSYALMMLWNASELVNRLDEEYSLYILAFAIRHLVRMPKIKGMLDPFPDELE